MKLYRTKENNIINLDQVSVIYKDPIVGDYRIQAGNGTIFEFPELSKEDIDKMMEYNNFFIE